MFIQAVSSRGPGRGPALAVGVAAPDRRMAQSQGEYGSPIWRWLAEWLAGWGWLGLGVDWEWEWVGTLLGH